MTERRYTEAEVAAIFERATEAPSTGSPTSFAGDGMTLAQLHEIGAEIGVSAESITVAATSVEQPVVAPPRKFLGIALSAGRTVALDRRLTDIEWERLVAELRETFQAHGKLTSDGSLRSWSVGSLQVLLEPTAAGQRIRLVTAKNDAPVLLFLGPAITALVSVPFLAAFAQGPLSGTGLIVALMSLGIAGASMYARTAFSLRRWARTRQQQFDAIAARVLLTTKSLPPGSGK